MIDSGAAHPAAQRLEAYALGRLIGPEMDEIEQHLSGCDSCCQLIRNQPADSLVAKASLRPRRAAFGAALAADEEAAMEQVAELFRSPSSFAIGRTDDPAVGRPPRPSQARPPTRRGWARLPQALNDHPRYRIVDALGAGGMGAVYRAEHRLMDRPVALKVIRGDLLGSAAMVERFRGEVKAAARLAPHPNIVAAYDAEQVGETQMLVMEFVEGFSLAELVKRRGPLPIGDGRASMPAGSRACSTPPWMAWITATSSPTTSCGRPAARSKILDFGLARVASEAACAPRPDQDSRPGRGPGLPASPLPGTG